MVPDLTGLPKKIKSFDDYLESRLDNGATHWFREMCFWGMNFCLPQAEQDVIFQDITRPAMLAGALMNDYFSWPKELREHEISGRGSPPTNIVLVLMKEYQLSETEAICLLRRKITEFELAHLDGIKKLEMTGPVSENHYKFFFVVQCASAATCLWSTYSPRYPSKATLSQVEFRISEANHRLRPQNAFAPVTKEEIEAAIHYRPFVEPEYNSVRHPQFKDILRLWNVEVGN